MMDHFELVDLLEEVSNELGDLSGEIILLETVSGQVGKIVSEKSLEGAFRSVWCHVRRLSEKLSNVAEAEILEARKLDAMQQEQEARAAG